jgi:hypothetical protein
MSFAELKEEVLKLTDEQKAELAAVLHGWKDDEWDKQMKADAAAGKLDHLIAEADAAIDAGRTAKMP